MLFSARKIPFYRRKKILVPLIFFSVLIALRIIAPTAIKVGLNNYLDSEDFSPSLRAHVGDVDLALLRGVYTLEDISADIKTKNKHKQFLQLKSATARLAWRDLFKGELVTDIGVDGMDFTYAEELLPALKQHMAKMNEVKKDEEKDPSALRVARFDLKNSVIRTDLFPDLTKEQGVVMTELEARATNLTPTKDLPRTPFSMQGLLLKSGKVKTEGEADLTGEKPMWTVDSEIKNFDLTSLNRFLKQKVPLTFTTGKLDLYAEAKSEDGPVVGYIKPFIKNLDVIKTNENFKGPKHWLIEIISALGNVVMKADETMATKVPFTFDQTLKPDTDKTIAKAIEHGFFQEQNRGIENSIDLKTHPTRQSQEDKK